MENNEYNKPFVAEDAPEPIVVETPAEPVAEPVVEPVAEPVAEPVVVSNKLRTAVFWKTATKTCRKQCS